MTSQQFRSDPLFLRNQFAHDGKFEIPVIKRQNINLSGISLLGYDQTRQNDEQNKDKFIHFFLDDYKFDSIWNDPEKRIAKLKQYKGILSPQYSVYYTMPIVMQMYNTFRSRWCGAYFQAKGFDVIPTISWGMEDSFDFCFDGIEKGSIVAVSTLGVKKEKEFFMSGYNEMLRRIEPQSVICYSKPFKEMDGNIISIDYATTNNLSKKFFSYVQKSYEKWFLGYVTKIQKGSGAAGGTPKFPGWDPSKPPGQGFEWRGKGDPSSGKGAWYNPNTKETYHPDLNHPEPYGPHWDYNYPGGGDGFRLYPNGQMVPKIFEGDMKYG